MVWYVCQNIADPNLFVELPTHRTQMIHYRHPVLPHRSVVMSQQVRANSDPLWRLLPIVFSDTFHDASIRVGSNEIWVHILSSLSQYPSSSCAVLVVWLMFSGCDWSVMFEVNGCQVESTWMPGSMIFQQNNGQYQCSQPSVILMLWLIGLCVLFLFTDKVKCFFKKNI